MSSEQAFIIQQLSRRTYPKTILGFLLMCTGNENSCHYCLAPLVESDELSKYIDETSLNTFGLSATHLRTTSDTVQLHKPGSCGTVPSAIDGCRDKN